jgi:enamine deaminase RidA (YjgF/YER057c/UK114 family)
MNPDITRIGTGPRMSEAIVHGNTVYVAGQVGTPGGSVIQQTRDALAEVDRILALAGTNKTRILSAQIWLADMASFPDMNAVWDAWVPQGHTPARATGESRLATPDYLVEVIVVAAK